MVRKIYVGNLPFSFTENSLKDLFSGFGLVESVKIVTDINNGRSKGFGFVEMSTPEEASSAVQNLNGTDLEGRTLRVDLAKPKEEGFKSRPGGFERRGPRVSSGRNETSRRNRW